MAIDRRADPIPLSREAWVWTTGYGIERITVEWDAVRSRWYWEEGGHPVHENNLHTSFAAALAEARAYYWSQIASARRSLAELREHEAQYKARKHGGSRN
jgi:hypothetical protein